MKKYIIFLVIVFIGITYWSCKEEEDTIDIVELPIDKATTKPSTPTGLIVGNPTSSSFSITWDAVSEASSYQLFSDRSANGSFVSQTYSTANTFVTHTGLSSGTTYYYKVRATNSVGSSELSSAVSGTTNTYTPPPGTVPPTPTGISVGSPTTTSLTINWDPVSVATSYQVSRSSSSDFLYPSGPYDITGTTFIDTGLLSGRKYYYKVRAENAAGVGAWSGVYSGTTL